MRNLRSHAYMYRHTHTFAGGGSESDSASLSVDLSLSDTASYIISFDSYVRCKSLGCSIYKEASC